MRRYNQIQHTADLAAEIYGRNLPELFENAAFAMFDMMADLDGLKAEESVRIKAEGPDQEGLLISWLNELLYTAYIKRIIFTEFRILSLEENNLTAEAKGQKFKEGTNLIKSEIKAATYHDVKIEKTGSGYEVTIVFDV